MGERERYEQVARTAVEAGLVAPSIGKRRRRISGGKQGNQMEVVG